MTIAEIRQDLRSKIDHLSDEQLHELHAVVSNVLLVKEAKPKNRKAGTMKGLVTYIANDFDAPLDDFNEYMVEQTT